MKRFFSKHFIASLIALPGLLGFWSCTQQEEATPEIVVTEVAVEAPFNIIAVGETLALSATLAPENASDKAMTWRSNNPRIATVDETGTVTGIGSGLVNITCAAKENPQVKNTVELQVVEVLVPVTSLVIQDLEKDVLEGGETIQLITIINPQESTDKTVIWSSDNEAVATVNETGLVTGVRDGSVTITATSKRYPTKTSSVALNVVTTTNAITSFTFEGLDEVQPTISDTEIVFEIDFNKEGKALDLTALTPVIQHNGLSLEPETGVQKNFTEKPVFYTVTSGSGEARTYTVSVKTKPGTELITTWKGQNITIPVNSGFDYKYNVDWNNDGFIDQTGITGAVAHDFGAGGEHTIRISGNFPNFQMGDAGNQLVSLEQWGTISWESMVRTFANCSGLKVPATDAPDLSRVTSMVALFQGAYNVNPDFSHWNTANVTDVARMFKEATETSPNLSYWDVSKVTDMQRMFQGAKRTSPNLSHWKTPNLTNLVRMFKEAKNTSPDLSGWDTYNVTNMGAMFSHAENTNPDISDWNTTNVTTMGNMFEYARNTNPDIGNWNTPNLTHMGAMFHHSDNTNPDISNWNTANVTSMAYMFNRVDNNTIDVSKWDTGNVTSMERMFYDTEKSNINVSNWNTANVTSIEQLFESATNANPDVSKWNISKVQNIYGLFFNSGISRFNYQKALLRFADHATDPDDEGLTLPTNLNIGVVEVTYLFSTASIEALVVTLGNAGWEYELRFSGLWP